MIIFTDAYDYSNVVTVIDIAILIKSYDTSGIIE
jgi:hypothetical protein